MKVLHVRETGGEGAVVELHPQVTVIRGLSADRRAWLIDTLSRLSSGAVEADGEMDAHGVLFPLDRPSLALLGLERQVDAVVRASDLPGHDPRWAQAAAAADRAKARRKTLTDEITRHRAALGAAIAERDAATAALEELERGEGAAREVAASVAAARTRLQAELASATREREEAESALAAAVHARDVRVEARESADRRVESARERHREAMAAASAAAAAVEEADSIGDDDPTLALAAARDELERAEAAAAEADPAHDESPLNRRLAALENRRVELDRLLDAMGAPTTDPVLEALERVNRASDEAPPVVAALALADTWRDLHQQISALDAGVSPAELAAEERVVVARRAVAEAESDFNQPVLTPEQITKVEAAHQAVLEAQDRTDGRFGGGRARKKLDESRAEERRILERLGFSTYADYMMSSSSRGVGPANRAILETAKAQLAAANAELAALPGAADRARRRMELFQRRDAVAPRVADLLGHEPTGPEAEEELRELREPVAPDAAALAGLADALGAAGIVVGPAPYEREDLVLLARSYLAEEEGTAARRDEAAAAIEAIDGAIAVLRDARDRGATDPPQLDPLPELAEPVPDPADEEADARAATLRESRWAKVEEARTAVAEGEAAVARHRDATDRIGALREALAATATAETAARAAVEVAETEAATARGSALDEAVAAAVEAEAALTRSRVREDEARERLAKPDDEEGGVAALVAAAQERVRAAEAAVKDAAAAEQSTAAELAVADGEHTAAKTERDAAAHAAQSLDRSSLVDEVDWALLQRLAAVRNAGHAGSVPLVLDDPFVALEDDEVVRVLDKVIQLAGAVQLVVVTDHDAVIGWASDLGADLAVVVAA